jgi:hypothetical protein
MQDTRCSFVQRGMGKMRNFNVPGKIQSSMAPRVGQRAEIGPGLMASAIFSLRFTFLFVSAVGLACPFVSGRVLWARFVSGENG